MKKLFLTAVFIGAITFCSQAQTLSPQNLPTLEKLIINIQTQMPGVNVLPESFDQDPPSEVGRHAYPNYDYSYADGTCCYIMHAYRHSFLGIEYGDLYYNTELVGCI